MSGSVVALPREFSLDDLDPPAFSRRGQPVFANLERRIRRGEGPISPVHSPYKIWYEGKATDLVVLKYSGRRGWDQNKLAQTSVRFESEDDLSATLNAFEGGFRPLLIDFLRKYGQYKEKNDTDAIETVTLINAEWMRNVAGNGGEYAHVTVNVYPDRVRVDAEQGGEPFDVLACWKSIVLRQKRGYGFQIEAGLADELLFLDRGRIASYQVARRPLT